MVLCIPTCQSLCLSSQPAVTSAAGWESEVEGREIEAEVAVWNWPGIVPVDWGRQVFPVNCAASCCQTDLLCLSAGGSFLAHHQLWAKSVCVPCTRSTIWLSLSGDCTRQVWVGQLSRSDKADGAISGGTTLWAIWAFPPGLRARARERRVGTWTQWKWCGSLDISEREQDSLKSRHALLFPGAWGL